MLTAFQPTIYIQLSPDRVTLRNAKTGVELSEVPEVAIMKGPPSKIMAVGAAARSSLFASPVEVVNPFGHPRSLVSDFIVGEQLLKTLLRQLTGRSILALAPKVVLHPQGNPAGGFTQIEIRALHEMGLGTGAMQVTIWQGRSLTDEELLSGRFPSDGQMLS